MTATQIGNLALHIAGVLAANPLPANADSCKTEKKGEKETWESQLAFYVDQDETLPFYHDFTTKDILLVEVLIDHLEP